MKFQFSILMVPLIVITTDVTAQSENNKLSYGKFLDIVLEEMPGTSLISSPFSILTPMSVLADASTGPTQKELLNALGYTPGESHKQIDKDLESAKGIKLNIANKFFLPMQYDLNKTFSDMSKKTYGLEVSKLDFSPTGNAAATINNWVDKATNHQIKEIISPDSISTDTRMIIVNAIYFKGTWKYKFDASKTMERNFNYGRKVTKIPMMKITARFGYTKSERLQAQILEMHYDGEEASMIIILPNQGDGIKDLIHSQLLETLEGSDAFTNMIKTDVRAIIPKFKIETTIDLKTVLNKVGVIQLFNSGAELPKLLAKPEDLYVSDFTQKAFIEVNEEGTEASAVSAVNIMFKGPSLPTPEPPEFLADHPFVYLIRIKNQVVFAGAFYG